MIKVVQNCSSFFASIWLTRTLTIHNTVHWSVRHTQSFRCLLIYQDSIKISKSKLTLTLIDLGYTYKKIGDNRRVLYDQVSIINDRCNYLRKMKSLGLTRTLTIHNTVHWSVRHTQSFRCPLIYPIKWENWLLRCLFLTKKGKQLFYKLLAVLFCCHFSGGGRCTL
jgi:hypothetical protein